MEGDPQDLLPWERTYIEHWGSNPADDVAAGFGADVATWQGNFENPDGPPAAAASPLDPFLTGATAQAGATREVGLAGARESQRASMASDATRRAELDETIRHNKAYIDFLKQELMEVTKPKTEAEIEALKQELILAQRKQYADITGYTYTLPGEPTPPPSQVPQMLSQTWAPVNPAANPLAQSLAGLAMRGR